ncbi:MAG: TetR/AcrR family transcriptional regulator [Myxococcota bacterium]
MQRCALGSSSLCWAEAGSGCATRDRSGPSRFGRRRAEILGIAAELFAAHGYLATSTRALAQRAGVSEGLIFHHFGTKEGVLEALVDEGVPHRIATSLGACVNVPLAALPDRLAEVWDDTESGGRIVATLSRDAAADPGVRGHIRVVCRRMAARLEAIVGARIDAGELPATVDPAGASAALMKVLLGHNILKIVEPSGPPLVDQLALILRGLRAPRSRTERSSPTQSPKPPRPAGERT